MKKILSFVLAFFALTAFAVDYPYETFPNDPAQARRYTLPNGLTVYMSRNAEKPEIQTMIAVRAGGQNDPLNSTGLAHYLEHLMFKGTRSYGTTDYEKEVPLLRQIDDLYEQYGQTTDPEKRAAIYHLIDSVSYLNSKIAVANEFDKLMSLIGATGVNAYTSDDRTCYHEVIPAGELRRWAIIESDRFQNMVIRGFHTELEAVYEEFNMYSTMDRDKVMLAVNNILYPNVPYRQHSIIGTQEHLKNPSIKNIRRFYDNYYRPNNVVICLAGDLDFDKTIAIIDEYFGQWQPNPAIENYETPYQAPLTHHRDTVVLGKESPEVWMGWRMPDITHEDIDVIEVMESVLQNGKCGLLDVDIDQQQRMLSVGAGALAGKDFTTFFMIGSPKEGQSLEEVRKMLLDEIEKLKRGEFSERMLQAIIANARRYEMQSLQSNRSRANKFLHSFIYGIPYADLIGELDRKSKVTKEDIMRVANRYFTDSYACVFKKQGEDVNPPKVDKPKITPIDMNREAQSARMMELAAMSADQLQPQFLDFNRDLSRSTLNNGQELLYVQNNENELFELDFCIEKGTHQDPSLSLATDLLSYLGTATMTTEVFQSDLYQIAAEAGASAYSNETHFHIYGLQENFLKTLQLLEDWVLTARAEETVYQEVVADRIKAHEDSKLDQRSCFGNLRSYGTYGKKNFRRMVLTPKQMKKLSGEKVLARLRELIPGMCRVTYYGPMSEGELKQVLNTQSKLVAQGKRELQIHSQRLQPEVVKKSEDYIAPFDANTTYYVGYANWGEIYTPKDEAIIRLYNEYFDGSMGSIVFQEMREARALCYTSAAYYSMAGYKGENNSYITYIITQNDKLKDCMLTFDSICNFMPMSQAAFAQAKSSLLKNIEKRRYVRSAPIGSYLGFRDKGWDHDLFEDIYREVKNLTLEDVQAFQKKHVANRTYRYFFLGNEQEMPMDFLKTRGTVRRLKIKDIFVY